MKKVFSLLVAAVVAGSLYADGLYRDSVASTVYGTTAVTNLGTAPIQISAIESTYDRVTNATFAVSRIRAAVTNLMVSQWVTNATSVFFNKGEFEGAWFKQNDIIYIDTGIATSTNRLILTTEDAR